MEFADEVSHGPTACRPRRRCPQILEIGKTIEPVHDGRIPHREDQRAI
jgi:hypothetical protein